MHSESVDGGSIYTGSGETFFEARDGSRAEHLEYFGELLPHVFLADVMRRTIDFHEAAVEAGQDDEAAPIIDYLEDRLRSGDERVQELISTGFVEVLPREGERGYALRCLFGPDLSAEARRVA